VNDYYVEAMGTFAAYGAPWDCCGPALRHIACERPVQSIEHAIVEHSQNCRAAAATVKYPHDTWLLNCLDSNCPDAFVLWVYVSLLIEMIQGLTRKDELEQAALLARQLIDIFDRGKRGDLPGSIQSTMNDPSKIKEGQVKQALIAVLRRQGRADEAMALIQETPYFSLADFDLKYTQSAGEGLSYRRKKRPSSFSDSPHCLVITALKPDISFTEADKLLEKALAKMDERPQEEIPLDLHCLEPNSYYFGRVVNFYLKHSCFKTAERWFLLKRQKFSLHQAGQFDLCQKYCDCRFAAAIEIGMGRPQSAEVHFQRGMEVCREGGIVQPLIGQIISPDWLALVIFDYALCLEKQGRDEEAEKWRAEIWQSNIDFAWLIRVLLQPQNQSFDEWCRQLPWGYASAGLFESDCELVARCVEIVVSALENQSISYGSREAALIFLPFAAKTLQSGGKFGQALHCTEQAIELVEGGLASAPSSRAETHPDHLFELLNLQAEILHQSGDIEGGRQTQDRIERLRQKYFRQG